MVLINNTSRDPDQAEFHFKLIPFIGVIQTVIERGLHEEENIDLIRFSPLLTWNLKNKLDLDKCSDIVKKGIKLKASI